MSVTDPFKSGSDPKDTNSEAGLAPHDALKMALQSMKERCCLLQTRISRLEEENRQLRIGKMKFISKPVKSEHPDFSNLEKKVEELLSNKEFWEKLSKLSEENLGAGQNLNNVNLCKKSQTSQKFTSPLTDIGYSPKEESLEEVSLKVISTIMRGKIGDCQQEAMNHNDISSIEEEDNGTESDVESLNLSLNDILKNIKRDKDLIKHQQEGLKAALQVFKNLTKDNSPCSVCLKKEEESRLKVVENKIVGTQESLRVDQLYQTRLGNPVHTELKDRICPLCEQYFHCSTPFDDFNEHVLTHFVEEETEEESLTGNFELIT